MSISAFAVIHWSSPGVAVNQARERKQEENMSTISPPYSKELFLDRDDPIGLVTGTIERVLRKVPHVPRTIIFEAERGSGKTWLALHLVRTVLHDYPVKSLFLCLRPGGVHDMPADNENFVYELTTLLPEEEDQKVPGILSQVISWIAQRIGAERAPNAEVRELSRWILETVDGSPTTFVLVLDSVYETSWKLLAELERYLLGPLSALTNVIIILTGRGRRYPWVSPDLRLNADGRHLSSLSPEDMKTMIEKQAGTKLTDAQVRELTRITGGSLLAAVIVARGELGADAANQAINELLPTQGVRDRRLREFFEALSPFDQFRDEQILPMLLVYYKAKNDPGKLAVFQQLHDSDIREMVRDEMLKTNLMRWENGGYMIDDALRSLMRYYLEKNLKDVWDALNERAYHMYMNWADTYKNYRDYYLEQAQKFARRLRNYEPTLNP
jgi:hypothetical protein